MKRIFFITNELSGGGAERVMSVLANYLCGAACEVKFLIFQKMNQEYPLDKSIEKIMWQDRKSGDAIGQIRFIRKYMKENPGATFVSFFTHQNLYTIIVSIGLKVKVVVSERNDPEHSINGVFKKFIRKILYASPLCNTIIFQTQGAKAYFTQKIQKKGVIIPNPLKEGLPEPYIGEREKTVVSFGRFEPQKNYSLLIKAFAEFVIDHDEYVLQLYGQGSLENELHELANVLGITDKIQFMGFDKNVHEKILKAGMFVLPSNYEGLSNSMLEAMAIGLPVICTDCPPGGARDILFSEKIGVKASEISLRLGTRIICKQWQTALASDK